MGDLHAAVEAGSLPRLRALLAAQPQSAAEQNQLGETALHLAAKLQRAAMIQPLLAAAPQAAVSRDHRDHTPLLLAAQGSWAPGVRALLQAAPCALLMADCRGRLPLHAAAIASGSKDVGALQLLLTAPAGAAAATATDSAGCTPLRLAAKRSADAVPLLLAAAPHTATIADSKEGRYPLHAAFAAPSLMRRCCIRQADGVEAKADAARQWRATTALQLLNVYRLIRAAPEAALQQDKGGSTAAHLAAGFASGANCTSWCEFGLLSLGLLIDAAPSAAAVADARGRKALDLIGEGLLKKQFQFPSHPFLPGLAAAWQMPRPCGHCRYHLRLLSVPLPTFAAVAERQPLSAAEWQVVPGDDSCLASALLAVLQRSAEEAGFLVARLPQADRLRLRVAAATLSVGRQDRPRLPPELVQRILALALLDLSWR